MYNPVSRKQIAQRRLRFAKEQQEIDRSLGRTDSSTKASTEADELYAKREERRRRFATYAPPAPDSRSTTSTTTSSQRNTISTGQQNDDIV